MGEEKLPTIEEAGDELKRKPVVDLWPILAVAYGVSKGPSMRWLRGVRLMS
jgi:hypothetical protein